MKQQPWIVVPNWDRFQHYGLARPPTWIKNYVSLLHKDEYLDLSLAARGLLHGIWLAYAERRGRIRAGADLAADLHAEVRHMTRYRYLDSIAEAGLIHFSASRPLTLNLSEDPPGSSEPPARARDPLAPRQRAENWIRNGAAAAVPASDLPDTLAANFHITDPKDFDELIAQALEWR